MKEKVQKKRILTKLLVSSLIIVVALGVVYIFNISKTDTPIKESPKTEQTPSNKMTADHIPTMQPCMNNEEIQCAGPPSIDFWPSGSEDAINPAYDRSIRNVKEIGGKILTITGNTIGLQTSDTRTYEITFPVNAIEEWNTNRSPNYKNYKIDIGDTLNIRYAESPEQASRTIGPSQILISSLAIRMIGGGDGTIERF